MMKLVRTLAKVLLTLTCNTVTAAAHTEKDTLLIDDRTETCDTVPDSLALAAKPRANIYDLPYSTRTSCPDWKRLWLNTGVLFAGGVATLGVLQLLPENATAWNKERITSIPFWKRWSYHVSRGPMPVRFTTWERAAWASTGSARSCIARPYPPFSGSTG